MGLGRMARVPKGLGPFFLYLRVVRGLSVHYALHLSYALRHKNGKPHKTASRYWGEFQTEWWWKEVEA